MGLSRLDLFKIGLGPSSSHTVGPMVAGNRFVAELVEMGLLEQAARVRVELFGSLAMTGKGHATDTAVMQGLSGEQPDQIDPDYAPELVARIRREKQIQLAGTHCVPFSEDQDLLFRFGHSLPKHPNGMTITVTDHAGVTLHQNNYYSVGGGFVLNETEASEPVNQSLSVATIPYPFDNATELLAVGNRAQLSIAEIVLANEQVLDRTNDIRRDLLHVWDVMRSAIDRGCTRSGDLPGGLGVKRRASQLLAELLKRREQGKDQLEAMDWVNLYAMAVNEENATGSRVVTAPTNGAAGVIPAVLAYYDHFIKKKVC